MHESEAKYRALFDALPTGITLADGDGNIVEANASATELLGIATIPQRIEHIGKKDWCIIRPDGTPMPPDECASVRALREKRPIRNATMGIVRTDGTTAWLHVTAVPIAWNNLRLITAYADISDHQRREAALKDKVALFDQVPTLARDMENRITAWNTGAKDLYGFSAEETIGRISHDILQTVFPRPYPELLQDLLTNGSWAGYLRHTAKDGRNIHVSSHWILHRNNNDTPISIIEVSNDVSEQKLLEKDLERANKSLQEIMAQLEDANTALRVVLKQHENDRLDMERRVLENMRLLVIPYLNRIRGEIASSQGGHYLDLAIKTFETITSDFTHTLQMEYGILTGNEIRVADMIRSGMTSKDIAAHLGISVATADYYRQSIRKKLNLTGKRTGLRIHLLHLSNKKQQS